MPDIQNRIPRRLAGSVAIIAAFFTLSPSSAFLLPKLDFARFVRVWASSLDPEEAFDGDEIVGFVEQHDDGPDVAIGDLQPAASQLGVT